MGKRSSKARRREPVRRPIPAARLSSSLAGPRTDLTEPHLIDGWLLDDGAVRVRLARSEDMPAVRGLTQLAGVELEPEVIAAVETGVAAAALRVAIRDGHEAMVRHMGEQFFAHQGRDLSVPFQHVTLVLVAEHDVDGVVGAAVAYPPISVIKQLVEHSRHAGPQQAMELLGSGALAIVRIKALAVADEVRGRGIGAELLHRCWQVFDHAGYMIVYGQAADTPELERFYRRHGFDVLDPGTGFDPWVVFGIHADVRPEPGERTFIRHRPSKSERSHSRRVPAQRRRGGNSQYDPGTLALHDAHLPYVLEKGSGEALAIQFLPLLWVKLAEGNRANACVDACVTLQHAYEQFGIRAEMVPVGVIVHDADGERTGYATERPHWTTDTEFVGHVVLMLPELGRLVDPTIEQLPEVRALGMGPVVGRIPPAGRDALLQGGTSFRVPRGDIFIDYVPVHPDDRDVLVDAPLLLDKGDAYRRAGINLATLALEALRAEGVVERVRQAPFPGLHALLDVVGDAPIEPDGAGDVRITLPDGAGGTVNLRLDELPRREVAPPAVAAAPAAPSRAWWGGRRGR